MTPGHAVPAQGISDTRVREAPGSSAACCSCLAPSPRHRAGLVDPAFWRVRKERPGAFLLDWGEGCSVHAESALVHRRFLLRILWSICPKFTTLPMLSGSPAGTTASSGPWKTSRGCQRPWWDRAVTTVGKAEGRGGGGGGPLLRATSSSSGPGCRAQDLVPWCGFSEGLERLTEAHSTSSASLGIVLSE